MYMSWCVHVVCIYNNIIATNDLRYIVSKHIFYTHAHACNDGCLHTKIGLMRCTSMWLVIVMHVCVCHLLVGLASMLGSHSCLSFPTVENTLAASC